MTLRIGRVELSPDSAITQATWNGRLLSLEVEAVDASLDEMVATRTQLLAYPTSQEPVIPIVWDETSDDSVTGFYRVLAVSSSAAAGAYVGFMVLYRFELEWIGGAEVLWESVLEGALRTNTNSITSGTERHSWARPLVDLFQGDTEGLYEYDIVEGKQAAFADSGDYVEAIDGTNERIIQHPDVASLPGSRLRWSTTPRAFYNGGCMVEYRNVSTDPYRLAVGLGHNLRTRLQSRETLDVGGQLRIGNGLVRCTIEGDGNNVVCELEFYKQTASYGWQTTDSVVIGGEGWVYRPAVVDVIRNSPHIVTVRVIGESSNNSGAVVTTLSLRRGMTWLSGHCSRSVSSGTQHFEVYYADAVNARDVLTGGHRRGADDANGYRVFIGSEDATFGTESSEFHYARSGAGDLTFGFCFGVEDDGFVNSAQNAIYEYHSTLSEEVRVSRL